MKTCSRCKKIKPEESFSRNARATDGRQSWCKDCMNNRVRDWHRDNPNFIQPNSHGHVLQHDAVEYTKRHCAHVAKYVARAITRLEQSGLEPPPQLEAIHEMAAKFADQQADLIDRRRTCQYCGTTFTLPAGKGHGHRRYCNDLCKHRMAWLKRDKAAFNSYKRKAYHDSLDERPIAQAQSHP